MKPVRRGTIFKIERALYGGPLARRRVADQVDERPTEVSRSRF
jgi:hypothetical protein